MDAEHGTPLNAEKNQRHRATSRAKRSAWQPPGDPAASSAEIELRLLMEAIYLKYSYDFRDYAGASQKRRVLQALAQLDCPTIPALQAKVLHDPALFMQLLQYLTIPVSEMFRDPT
ncbi:MAG: hypothetical protein Q7T98_08950, partial [Polaromonas sp.]|nr:hypothetical protein [Polaromonas sp.]